MPLAPSVPALSEVLLQPGIAMQYAGFWFICRMPSRFGPVLASAEQDGRREPFGIIQALGELVCRSLPKDREGFGFEESKVRWAAIQALGAWASYREKGGDWTCGKRGIA